MHCTICAHEARGAMERAMVVGMAVKSVARQHGVSYFALRRHRDHHLPNALVGASEQERKDHASDLLADAIHLRGQANAVLIRARERGDDLLALKAVRESLRCLEFEARLKGELVERETVEIRERSVVHTPIVLTAEERRVLEPIKRRLLLGGAPGFVEDAVWYATEPQDDHNGPEAPDR